MLLDQLTPRVPLPVVLTVLGAALALALVAPGTAAASTDIYHHNTPDPAGRSGLRKPRPTLTGDQPGNLR